MHDAAARFDRAGKIGFRGHGGELRSVEIVGEPFPGFLSARQRTHRRVDPDQRHAAQDEGRDRGRQVHSAGEPACGNRAAVPRHRQHVGERGRAYRIDAAGPALLAERPCGSRELVARDDLARTQALEIVRLGRAPSRGDDGEPQFGKQRHRHRAHAAGRSGHDHRSVPWREAVMLERHHRQHCSEPGGADRHRLARAHARRQADQPVALNSRLLRIAAEMGLADAPTGENDRITRLPLRMRGGLDSAGKIDAGDHRKSAHDRRLAGDGQPVLVVHRRPGDAHGDITLHQVGLVEIDEPHLLAGVGLLHHDGLECRHASPRRWRP